MANDYISREAAIKAVCDSSAHTCNLKNCFHGCQEAQAILAIPAADVAPVKRGRWVKANGSWLTPGGDPVWECSECGKGRHVYGVEHGSYGSDIADDQWVSCPNCGCTMDV